MKFTTFFVMLCVLAGCALSQYTPPDTTEYQPETTDSHYWDPDTTPQPETTARPDQQPCNFPGPCGQVTQDAKKLYFFF
ncbi:hypothetical protein KR059_009615 [Drosophila kikkawai]|nr:hypothetical protein KR059_009615 [Drosophila kikkawai]